MSDEPKCATCGSIHGAIVNDMVVRLSRMRMMPIGKLPEDIPDGFGNILICKSCRELLIFDIGKLVDAVDRAEAAGRSNHDQKLFWFFTLFIKDVWGAPKPPTFHQLAEIMNSAGIQTQQAVRWEYHNVRQKCLRLGINIMELHQQAIASKQTDIPHATVAMIGDATAVLAGHKKFGPQYIQSDIGGTGGYGDMPQLPGEEQETEQETEQE